MTEELPRNSEPSESPRDSDSRSWFTSLASAFELLEQANPTVHRAVSMRMLFGLPVGDVERTLNVSAPEIDLLLRAGKAWILAVARTGSVTTGPGAVERSRAEIEELKELFSYPEDQRSTWIAQRSSGVGGTLDLAKKAWLERAIRDVEADDPLLRFDTRFPINGNDVGSSDSDSIPVPARIGRYRILRVLGRGGMGVVYLAEQESPRRQVALKTILPHLVSPDLQKRFEREAQVLANLEHPGIIQVFESGRADVAGQEIAYFAMQYVDGSRLDDYCANANLDRDRIIELLAELCAIVGFAHERNIVHCDLKPGNVVVDSSGRPHVLDFGIARATNGSLDFDALTRSCEVMGTLDYMPPEQASGRRRELDARADVYALGAIAYFLLTGKLPLQLSELDFATAIDAIRSEEPALIGAFDRDLRGDLEVVIAKALDKDSNHRYRNARELGDELRRVRSGEPISARPPGPARKVAKWVRCNRFVATVLSSVIVSTIVISVLQTRHAMAIALERNEIQELAAKAQYNDRYWSRVVDLASPIRVGQNLPLSEAISRAAAELPSPVDPEHEMDLRESIANLLLEQGDFELAKAQYEKVAAVPGHDRHAHTFRVRGSLINIIGETRSRREAAQQLSALVRECEIVCGEDDPTTLMLKWHLARELRLDGQFAASLAIHEQLREPLSKEGAPRGEWVENELGRALLLAKLCRVEEAERLLDSLSVVVVAEDQRIHLSSLFASNVRIQILLCRQDYPSAVKLSGEVAVAYRSVLGADHLHTLDAYGCWLNLLTRIGEDKLAAEVARELVALHTAKYGAGNAKTLIAKHNMALTLETSGRAREAAQLFEEVVAGFRACGILETTNGATTLYQLAGIRSQLGDTGPAAKHLDEAEKIARAQPEVNHEVVALIGSQISRNFLAEDRWIEAETKLTEVLAESSERLGKAHDATVNVRLDLVNLLCRRKRFQEAHELLMEIGGADRIPAGTPLMQTRYLAGLGWACLGLGRSAESINYFADAEKRTFDLAGASPAYFRIRALRTEALLESGDIAAAREAYVGVRDALLGNKEASYPNWIEHVEALDRRFASLNAEQGNGGNEDRRLPRWREPSDAASECETALKEMGLRESVWLRAMVAA